MIVTANGGVTALNFRFVNGTSTPSNPVENTFWVKTATAINGWYFGPEQPSPASAGMVWVKTGTSSSVPFNTLKKNGIWVYPEAVYQYASSKWTAVNASIYQGSKWVDISSGGSGTTSVVLYETSNQHTDLTGGWSGSGWSDYADTYTETNATVGTSGIVLRTSGTGNRACVCGTANKVSFNGKQNIAVTVSSYTNSFFVGISPGKQFWDDDGETPMLALTRITAKGTANLSIPSGVSSAYVVLYGFSEGSGKTFGTVSKVELN